MRIAIIGSGIIGLYIGGRLLEAGAEVYFLGRKRWYEHLKENGLKLNNFNNESYQCELSQINYIQDLEELPECDVAFICAKNNASSELAKSLIGKLSLNTILFNLQNGVNNSEIFRTELIDHRIYQGSVSFNVVYNEHNELYAATSGPVTLEGTKENQMEELLGFFYKSKLDIYVTEQIEEYKWGKLVLNLNNSINALAGIPLKEELEDRDFRVVLAKSITEALAVAKSIGVKPAKVAAAPPWLLPFILKLPNFLFKLIAKQMINIDPQAKSSMLDDFERGVPTEIDYLNGEIVRLGQKNKVDVSVNAKIYRKIKTQEEEQSGSPKIPGYKLRYELEL
jgi:2-dehydropantoate 2-reductase